MTSTNVFGGFLTSADGGDSWTRLPDDPTLAASQSSFAWWFGKVWVNPDNAAHVHLAGVSLMTTHDGGQTWTVESEAVHADQHAMAWDPRYPSRVYLGNDGGLYRSDSDGDGGWVKATHEPYTQFYSAAITPQDGDGEENLINPTDVNNAFACFRFGNCFRSTDGGNTTVPFADGATSDRRNWFTRPVRPQRSERHVLRPQPSQPQHRQRPDLDAHQPGPHR